MIEEVSREAQEWLKKAIDETLKKIRAFKPSTPRPDIVAVTTTLNKLKGKLSEMKVNNAP